MFSLKDFNKLSLPYHWWYILDANGQGKAVDFPVKMKAYLGNSPKHFIVQAKDNLMYTCPGLKFDNVDMVARTAN